MNSGYDHYNQPDTNYDGNFNSGFRHLDTLEDTSRYSKKRSDTIKPPIYMSKIPGASTKNTADGKATIEKLKTPIATFSLRPVKHKVNTYTVQVTCKELPGLFKNSGSSSFGWFTVIRHPGRNEVRRPKSVKPLAGNATLMWPNIQEVERQRCLEYIEKVIRENIPRMELPSRLN